MVIFRVFIALSFAVLTSTQAWACSCIGIDSKSVSEHVGDKTVFVGTPISSRSANWYDDAVTTFKVHKGLQGEYGETVEIRHTQSGASCGVRYKTGETQMILAYKTRAGLATGLCSNPLPPILIVNFFETQDDLLMKNYGECRENGFHLVPDPESKNGELMLAGNTPACEIHTRKGGAEVYAAWQAWLDRQYFDPQSEP